MLLMLMLMLILLLLLLLLSAMVVSYTKPYKTFGIRFVAELAASFAIKDPF